MCGCVLLCGMDASTGKKACQFVHGARSVTDGVFHIIAQFGKGESVAFGLEDRVVAEALSSPTLCDDAATHDAFKEKEGDAVCHHLAGGCIIRCCIFLVLNQIEG